MPQRRGNEFPMNAMRDVLGGVIADHFFFGAARAGMPLGVKGLGAAASGAFGFFGLRISRLLRLCPLAMEASCTCGPAGRAMSAKPPFCRRR
jgi:hypothetical protein